MSFRSWSCPGIAQSKAPLSPQSIESAVGVAWVILSPAHPSEAWINWVIPSIVGFSIYGHADLSFNYSNLPLGDH